MKVAKLVWAENKKKISKQLKIALDGQKQLKTDQKTLNGSKMEVAAVEVAAEVMVMLMALKRIARLIN